MKKFTLEEMKDIVENAPEGSYWYSPEGGVFVEAYLDKTKTTTFIFETMCNKWVSYKSTPCKDGTVYYQLSKLKRLIQKEEQL